SSKTYDATTNATLSGTAALLSNDAAGASTTDGHPYTGDTVMLGGTAVGTFASKNVANGISVTVSGNTLSGTQASDYVLAADDDNGAFTANIKPKSLPTRRPTDRSSKTYAATTAAPPGGTAALLGNEAAAASTSDGNPYTGDTVRLGGAPSGTFASKDVANGI